MSLPEDEIHHRAHPPWLSGHLIGEIRKQKVMRPSWISGLVRAPFVEKQALGTAVVRERVTQVSIKARFVFLLCFSCFYSLMICFFQSQKYICSKLVTSRFSFLGIGFRHNSSFDSAPHYVGAACSVAAFCIWLVEAIRIRLHHATDERAQDILCHVQDRTIRRHAKAVGVFAVQHR